MATNEHTRYYAFENDVSDFKELSAEAAENYGGDGALVEVEWKGPNHWTLSCVQYYARDGLCQLEITQSLNRALQTFAAILAADAELEGGEIHMSHH